MKPGTKRVGARSGSARVPGAPVWFLDLDDTLHDASHAIYREIDTRMTAFVARQLGCGADEADRVRRDYWQRYGATMLGLLRHHRVDPGRFLRETHDFDVATLLRAERGIGRLLARLPGRKVLLTNAPLHYAGAVLAGIGLHRQLRTRYAIEAMRVHGTYRPKPSRAMLRHVLAREGLAGRANAGRAVLVEDSPDNLRAARAVGMRTVLVLRHGRQRLGPRVAGGSYVDLRVAGVSQLPRTPLARAAAARMRGPEAEPG